MNKLSTILNNAADLYLCENGEGDVINSIHKYSCLAVNVAARKFFDDHVESDMFIENTIDPFLKGLGLPEENQDTDSGDFHEFIEGSERQSVRYCWLKFAAMIAEEGI